MIVVCPNCNTRYGLDDNKVDAHNFIARCAKCQHTFTAYRPVRVEEVTFLDLETAQKNWDDNNIIAISNQKGGVAKTSTCMNLGLSLAMQGKRVLLVDFDVQANLTISLGQSETSSFYDILNGGGTRFEDLVVKTTNDNLWLFPSNKNMVLLNKKYFGTKHFEFILKDRLSSVRNRYDFILIDTPPSIEFFTLNALTAARSVIIPSQCDYLSTHGIDQILKLISLIKTKANPSIEPRILVTMFDSQSTASKMICSKLKRMYPGMLFDTQIEMDNRIREAQILSMPVLQYNQQSKAGQQYLRLAREILGKPLDQP